MKPMLAANTPLKRTEGLLMLDDYWLQQKLDGQRVLVRIDDGDVYALNRSGAPKVTGMTSSLLKPFERFADGAEWFFDGELMPDGRLWLFDLAIDPTVPTTDPYRVRYGVLEGLLRQWGDACPPQICLLPTARTPVEKERLVKAVEAQDGEGWVLKHVNHPYRPGHRSEQVMKMKRIRSLDAVVTNVGIQGKENIEYGLFDGGPRPRVIGTCSAIGKVDVAIDDVIEVTYLYIGANGKLVQPRMTRKRDDKAADECWMDQLSGSTDKSVILHI
jgi:ATP-dependent DNA ligase